MRWRRVALATVGSLAIGVAALAWVDGTRSTSRAAVGRDEAVAESAPSSNKVSSSKQSPTIEESPQPTSQCFGTVSQGRLENGWQLPLRGPNFQAYSGLGWQLGRTYVHSTVHEIVLETYEQLAETRPNLQFVYGETGLARGGVFRPHRTHRSGISVDFMSPVRSLSSGEPAVLPTSAMNKWGYAIDFDESGEWDDYALDLDALADHLATLRTVAQRHGVVLKKVVLYPPIRRRLATTRAWPRIAGLPFSQAESWVRHDDHYHVDFGVRCDGFSAR